MGQLAICHSDLVRATGMETINFMTRIEIGHVGKARVDVLFVKLSSLVYIHILMHNCYVCLVNSSAALHLTKGWRLQ
jgi:hypothetical protein